MVAPASEHHHAGAAAVESGCSGPSSAEPGIEEAASGIPTPELTTRQRGARSVHRAQTARGRVLSVSPAPERRAPISKPRLVFFFSKASGRSRRVEGYLSQVLQRRRNHDSFELLNVDVDEHAELAERFRIEEVPTIVVVEDKRVRDRLASPRGCRDIERLLAPWLR